jgi:transcriptional regulator with XRE-family HTH domain
MATAKLRKVEETFPERLKLLRKERGWSQEDLAARLDVSPGSVGNWEMGPHEPHPKTLKKIAALFEVDVPYLLQGEQEEAPKPTALRERLPEYSAVNLARILGEIEEVRNHLDRITGELRCATTPPGAAAASYDQKRSGEGKGRAKESPEVKRTAAKIEDHQPK